MNIYPSAQLSNFVSHACLITYIQSILFSSSEKGLFKDNHPTLGKKTETSCLPQYLYVDGRLGVRIGKNCDRGLENAA